MKIFNNTISILFLISSVMIIYIAYADYNDAFANRKTYEMVHGKSVEEYVIGDYILIGIGTVGIILSAFRFIDKKRKKIWERIIVTLFISGVFLSIIGYIQWGLSGFNH